MRKLESRVLVTIRRHAMLEGAETVTVALSGGPDSVALLLVLCNLRRLLGIDVEAAHVNHGLRGRDSDRDEEFAADLCQSLGCRFSVRRLDGDSLARAGNLEQALRRGRYAALFQMIPPGGCVATGHTLDDQVETFFLKAARGAGPTGLGGIFPVRRGVTGLEGKRIPMRVVRPLIECGREAVVAYLRELGQDFRRDSSNKDLSLDRNWVRRRLLPELRDRLNPRILENVGRSTELLREIQVYLRGRAKLALERSLSGRDETGIRLRIPVLKRLPPALLHETLRLALGRARATMRGLTHAHVLAAAGLLESQSGKGVVIAGAWRVSREFDELRISDDSISDFAIELSIPGQLFVQELGSTIRARRVEAGRGQPGAIRLRVGDSSLLVRNPRPGDRLRLRRGWVKLSDLWREARVPLSQRRRAIVLESGGGLAWVEGIGAGVDFAPPEGSLSWVEIDIATETFGGGNVSKTNESAT